MSQHGHISVNQSPFFLTLRFTFSFVYFLGFYKCIMTYIYSCSVIQNSFTALRISFTLPFLKLLFFIERSGIPLLLGQRSVDCICKSLILKRVYSFPLICLSAFLTLPHCLDYCSFLLSFEILLCQSYNFVVH